MVLLLIIYIILLVLLLILILLNRNIVIDSKLNFSLLNKIICSICICILIIWVIKYQLHSFTLYTIFLKNIKKLFRILYHLYMVLIFKLFYNLRSDLLSQIINNIWTHLIHFNLILNRTKLANQILKFLNLLSFINNSLSILSFLGFLTFLYSKV